MTILTETFRDLGQRLHSHLAAATTMFPFLTAPGRCVLISSEIPPQEQKQSDTDRLGR